MPPRRVTSRSSPSAIPAACRPDPRRRPRPACRAGPGPAGPDGTLAVPAITGPVPGGQAVTAVVAVAADGTVVASSAPSLYPPGRAAASELPAAATSAIAAEMFCLITDLHDHAVYPAAQLAAAYAWRWTGSRPR